MLGFNHELYTYPTSKNKIDRDRTNQLQRVLINAGMTRIFGWIRFILLPFSSEQPPSWKATVPLSKPSNDQAEYNLHILLANNFHWLQPHAGFNPNLYTYHTK